MMTVLKNFIKYTLVQSVLIEKVKKIINQAWLRKTAGVYLLHYDII